MKRNNFDRFEDFCGSHPVLFALTLVLVALVVMVLVSFVL